MCIVTEFSEGKGAQAATAAPEDGTVTKEDADDDEE